MRLAVEVLLMARNSLLLPLTLQAIRGTYLLKVQHLKIHYLLAQYLLYLRQGLRVTVTR
ncbi:hypothetical protein CKA32_007109 [Geitlerinema sp. FC II]|nr:hypothetical protein CKA32_007109 [Geitlerinema sp. FC II]